MKADDFEMKKKIEKKGFTDRVGRFVSTFYQCFLSNYKDTKMGTFFVLITCFELMTAQMVYENLSQTPFVAVIILLISLLLGSLFIYLGQRIVKLLFRINLVFFFDWMVLSYLFMQGIKSGCIKTVRTESQILSVFLAFMLASFARTFYALVIHKRKTKMLYSMMLVSSIFVILSGIFFFGEGFQENKIADFLELSQEYTYDQMNAEDLTDIDGITMGPYQVMSLSYGEEEYSSLDSETIDLSMYVTDADGLAGKYRTIFHKMNLEEAKVKGMIWYPEEETNCPMLFLMHGNHNINETSFDGYAYLGEYLASFGYLVVSVDENILNTLSNENDARAILLLENMKMVETYILNKDNMLYRKGDFSKLAIAGHSRGGESVAVTYLFNQLERYTENGVRKISYDFDIQSIIAIAPTVDQFNPADHVIELTDVNYLLLQGANDQDIYGYMGMNQYENIYFTGEEEYIKTSLYIANANHGQFNSKWGRYDLMYPNSKWINVKNLMDEKQQQQIAKIMIKTFLDVTLLEKDKHKELLYNYRKYTEILPDTVYIQQYEDSSETIFCDFEEDVILETGTLPDVFIHAYQVGIWTEALETYSNVGMKKARENHVLRLKWTNRTNPYIQVQIPESDLKNQILTFSICDADERRVEENIYELLECEIVIRDSKNHSATINTKDYAILYPPIPTRLGKMQYLTGDEEYKKTMQTIRIPFSDFVSTLGNLDLQTITTIEIHILNKESGEVFLDKIGVCYE